MTIVILTHEDFAEITFPGPGEVWTKGDGLAESVIRNILDLHKGGHRTILVNMGKVLSIDNQSAQTLIKSLRDNSHIKVAFYNLKPFTCNSLTVLGIDQKILFANKEAALASFA